MVLGKAALHFKDKISDEQEILMNIADMIINLYAAESVLLRSEKIIKKYNKDEKSIYFDITKSFLYDTCVNVSNSGKMIALLVPMIVVMVIMFERYLLTSC